MGKKVKPQDTLGIIEAILDGKADFHQWGPLSDIQIFEWEGFVPDLSDEGYRTQFKARMEERLRFVANTAVLKEGYDKLPEDALKAIEKVVEELGM